MPGTYSHTTRADGSILTASIYNADNQNHITFQTPGGTDDYSTNVSQMQSAADPGEVGTESLPTDLAGELQRIRKIITEITGKTYWYESPGLALLNQLDNLFRVVGSSDATKKVAFEVDGLTTATTRTVTIPDRNLTIGPVLATPQASTSGTAIDFTSIPSGTKRITIMLNGVSTNGTNFYMLQIGDSGGIETSGYLNLVSAIIAASASTGGDSSSFEFAAPASASATLYGAITLTLENASTFTWACSGLIVRGDVATTYPMGGVKSLSAELDRVRITTNGGADTFDAGEINIMYE